LGKRQERSEQVWVRRKPLLFRAEEVVPPPEVMPFYRIDLEPIVEEKARKLQPELELAGKVALLKRVSLPALERMFGREEMKKMMKWLYERLTSYEVGNMLCRSAYTITVWLSGYEIPRRPPKKLYEVFEIVPRKAWLVPYPKIVEYEVEPRVMRSVKPYTILPSKELAYLFGLIFTDGSPHANAVRITGVKLPKYEWEFCDAVYEIAEKVAPELAIDEKIPTVSLYYRDEKGKATTREKGYKWIIYIYSTALSHTLYLPKWRERLIDVMTEPRFLSPFLAGVWDGDGSYAYEKKKPSRVLLHQAEKEVWWLKRVRESLEELETALPGPHEGEYKFVQDGKVYRGKGMFYTLHIKKASWADFIRLIDLYQRHPGKKESAKEFLEFVKGGGGSA